MTVEVNLVNGYYFYLPNVHEYVIIGSIQININIIYSTKNFSSKTNNKHFICYGKYLCA